MKDNMPEYLQIFMLAAGAVIVALGGVAVSRFVSKKPGPGQDFRPTEAAASQNSGDPLEDLAKLVSLPGRSSPVAPTRRSAMAGDKLDVPATLRRYEANFDGKRRSMLESMSVFENDSSEKEINRVEQNPALVTIDFKSRKELFTFISEINSVDVEAELRGSDGNGVSVPASFMQEEKYKSLFDSMKDSFSLRSAKATAEPVTGGLAELAKICEAKIELLPF